MTEVSLSHGELRFAVAALQELSEDVPQGLCPTMYKTLTYRGDLELKAMADGIARKLINQQGNRS